MTFVLNILHKDYSLLVADRKGHAKGPVTVNAGSITVTMTNGGIINGVRKIHLNGAANCALGYAGQTDAHKYLDQLIGTANGQSALRCVTDYVHKNLAIDSLEEILPGAPTMENQLIVSFFDEATEAFFSSYHLFTRFNSGTHITARKQNASPTLLHVGSGSANFEKAVGLDAINSFIADLKDGMGLADRLAWLDGAFEKVSAIDPGCGSDYDAVLATRDDPAFVFIRTGRETTLLANGASPESSTH